TPGTILATCALASSAALAAQTDTPREPRRVGSQESFIDSRLEQAVTRGHDFLAARQDVRGYWSQDVGFKLNTDYKATQRDVGHVGVSSLALMSFLAGGHVPGRGRYGEVIG